MSIPYVFLLLKARWRSALLVLVSVVAVVGAISALLPKKYSASAAVVLDVKSPDPIAGFVLPGNGTSSYMATQVDVFQSERVANRVVQTLKLDQSPELKRRWQDATGGETDFTSWLSDSILRDLEVRPARESNVISVTYTSRDPQLAASLANAFVAAYIATILELRVEPAKQYTSFFDDRSKQAREALEKAQTKLSAYQQQKGIIGTDERLDVENARLTELSTQYVTLTALANESESRRSQADANPNQMQEVLNNPFLSALKADLVRLEARDNELSARLGSQHPQVLENRSNMQQLRARVDTETKRITGSVSVNNTVNQSRLSQLRAALEEQRAKILRLKGQRDEVTVLLRDVENSQKAYDAVAARVSQTSMESQTTQTNVSVLKKAAPPSRPSSPRMELNIVVAVLLGALLAVGVVMLREMFDLRLRTEDEVIQLLKQPLLGVLPASASRTSTRRLLGDLGTSHVPRLAK
jgi:succinoglycan biosynthesis transport protein ExoP